MSLEHDPVGATVEADATGRTAEIFADIRTCMRLPMVTAIWRSLDSIEGGLESVWCAVRPVIKNNLAERVMQEMDQFIHFPAPRPLSPTELLRGYLSPDDVAEILQILQAYNRANALSLIALTALMRPAHISKRQVEPTPFRVVLPVLSLPPLLEQGQISPEHWKLLEKTTVIGAKRHNPAVPTLWRHLIHWPGFIDLMIQLFLPLSREGALFSAVENVTDFVEAEAPRIGAHIDRTVAVPEAARLAVENYIGKQPSVARMTTVGRCAQVWMSTPHARNP